MRAFVKLCYMNCFCKRYMDLKKREIRFSYFDIKTEDARLFEGVCYTASMKC